MRIIDRAKGDEVLVRYLDDSISSIMIVFMHGLGDLLMFLAPLHALRKQFPKTRIDLGIQRGLGQEAIVPDVDGVSDAHGAAQVHAQRTGDVRVFADREERGPITRTREEQVTHDERALSHRHPRELPERGAKPVHTELRQQLSEALRDVQSNPELLRLGAGQLQKAGGLGAARTAAVGP